jgi:hypothetical protein
MTDRIPGARYRVTFEVECFKVGGLAYYATTTDGGPACLPSETEYTLIGIPEPTVPGTVIRDASGLIGVLRGSYWWADGSEGSWFYSEFAQPVTVLYTPEVTE